MKILGALLVVTFGLIASPSAVACADPPRVAFRDALPAAQSVLIFQLTSAYFIKKPVVADITEEYAVGLIRVVESLRGDPAGFQLVKFRVRHCGAIRLNVGQYYLVATSQRGPLINFMGLEPALLDLTRSDYNEFTSGSEIVETVRKGLAGSPLPHDFPKEQFVAPLDVYPPPLPVR